MYALHALWRADGRLALWAEDADAYLGGRPAARRAGAVPIRSPVPRRRSRGCWGRSVRGWTGWPGRRRNAGRACCCPPWGTGPSPRRTCRSAPRRAGSHSPRGGCRPCCSKPRRRRSSWARCTTRTGRARPSSSPAGSRSSSGTAPRCAGCPPCTTSPGGWSAAGGCCRRSPRRRRGSGTRGGGRRRTLRPAVSWPPWRRAARRSAGPSTGVSSALLSRRPPPSSPPGCSTRWPTGRPGPPWRTSNRPPNPGSPCSGPPTAGSPAHRRPDWPSGSPCGPPPAPRTARSGSTCA